MAAAVQNGPRSGLLAVLWSTDLPAPQASDALWKQPSVEGRWIEDKGVLKKAVKEKKCTLKTTRVLSIM